MRQEIDSRTTSTHAGLFAALWSVAILVHVALFFTTPDPVSAALKTAIGLACLWTLLRPSDPRRLLLMAGVQVLGAAYAMPGIANHWLIITLANLFILASYHTARRAEGGPPTPGAFYAHFAPTLRLLLIVVYAWATLAKLNESFLDPRLSCATSMGRQIFESLPLVGWSAWFEQPAIWGTILIEGGLPLLLAFRRTRLLALWIGVPFHAVLAVGGHAPFTALALALYVAFLPDDYADRMRGFARSGFARSVAAAARSRFAFPVLAAGLLLLRFASSFEWVDPYLIGQALGRGQVLFILLVAAAWLAQLVLLLRGGRPFPYAPRSLRPAHPAHWALPVLLCLNGLCPYLGLKTENSFTMYSNLQTEAELWNHVLVPHGVKVFRFQDDLVRILDSSDPRLKDSALRNVRWVYEELQRYLSARPDVAVTFVHRGRRERVERAGDHPVLGRPPPFLLRKLFKFRNVLPPERNTCQH